MRPAAGAPGQAGGSDMTTTISDSSPGALTTSALTTLLDVPEACRVWVAAAFLLGAIARDLFVDPDTAGRVGRAGATDACHLGALTPSEIRVLHYLPTNLSAREIAGELYLSVNTVRTHQRHVYQKLGARSRTQAVEQARAFGLLAPPPRGRMAGGGSL
jgi:LuxR family maltose regulon positive regulatory protein